MRIGIDLDDVMVESLPDYVRRFGREFGCEVPVAEAAWEIFRRHPEISPAALAAFFAELERTEFLATRPVYPAAAAGVRALARAGHELLIVTGRLAAHLEQTRRILQKAALLDIFRALVHRPGMEEGAAPYKRRIVRECHLDLLIDDELHVARGVAEAGVAVLLVDRPWNQGLLPDGIARVKDWVEILAQVERRASGPGAAPTAQG
ncbi:MAG TPA: hypothetical protein VMG58_11110 [Candidatus Sulfotelmatobacter sp.]|nr:hypothetical protein [Candidatus Sulfotelmatobacter sp.]